VKSELFEQREQKACFICRVVRKVNEVKICCRREELSIANCQLSIKLITFELRSKVLSLDNTKQKLVFVLYCSRLFVPLQAE